MRSPEEGQKEKKGFDNPQLYPKTPSGFQCFVCGKQFGTNEERIEHLEEAPHGSMYDTASPRKGRTLDDFNNTNGHKIFN